MKKDILGVLIVVALGVTKSFAAETAKLKGSKITCVQNEKAIESGETTTFVVNHFNEGKPSVSGIVQYMTGRGNGYFKGMTGKVKLAEDDSGDLIYTIGYSYCRSVEGGAWNFFKSEWILRFNSSSPKNSLISDSYETSDHGMASCIPGLRRIEGAMPRFLHLSQYSRSDYKNYGPISCSVEKI